MARKRNKSQVFEQEYDLLRAAEKTLAQVQQKNIKSEKLSVAYEKLTQSYKRLLEDSRLMTSVSDRLQNKLNRANDEVKAKNEALEETVQLLTEARAGRKAAMFALGIALVLFMLSETLIEPQIDDWVAARGGDHEYDFWISLFFKGLIALLVKPLEGMIERYLVKREVEKRRESL